jgi:hypothetical protein
MKTVNQAAICNVFKIYPNAKTKGFTAETRNYLVSELADPDEKELHLKKEYQKAIMEDFEGVFPPNIIPDLFEIDRENKTIRLFEIEDTHPLTNEKLMTLVEWWWALDNYDFELELYVTDRYGFNIRKFDLIALCFHLKFDAPPNSKLTREIMRKMGFCFDPNSPKPNSSPPPVLPRNPQSL